MLIFIGVGIHPLSGAWEIVLIERFRVCLQACSCYFQHDTSSRIAQSGYKLGGLIQILQQLAQPQNLLQSRSVEPINRWKRTGERLLHRD
jgi:hypothetical protein